MTLAFHTKMNDSARSFFNNSKRGYSKVTCHKCKYTTTAMLISFRFLQGGKYEFWNTTHNGPQPRHKFTIQDGKPICNKCCGFSLDRPRPQIKMEGHDYTWFDGTATHCPKHHLPRRKRQHDDWIVRNIKKLKRQVKELQDELRKNSVPVRTGGSLHERDPSKGHDLQACKVGAKAKPLHS